MSDGFRFSELERAIVDSIKSRVEGKKVAIACSGGLDSGLISAISMQYAESVHLYTCGTANAFDVAMGKDLSERLNLPWTHCKIMTSNIEDRIRGIIKATGTSDPFTISYELQLFCVCLTAEEDIVLSGQGSDEYFMGCAKTVGQDWDTFDIMRTEGIDRLLKVSVPCEEKIAAYFGKRMAYPYLDPSVTRPAYALPPEDLVPADMNSRKPVLRAIAEHLGFPFLAQRTKKASQYGSGTTDLIRSMARARGMRYNEYIASFFDEYDSGIPSSGRGSVINARVDSVLKAEAEHIISQCGSDPSDVIARLYRRIINEGDLNFLDIRNDRAQ